MRLSPMDKVAIMTLVNETREKLRKASEKAYDNHQIKKSHGLNEKAEKLLLLEKRLMKEDLDW